jgi:hypothetical protein
MTDLYLCVPEDSYYYLYCDEAYKYNEKNTVYRESGFSLYCNETVVVGPHDTAFLKFGISSACAMKPIDSGDYEPRAFWLLPHPNISKTEFISANSREVIDTIYTGSIIGAVKLHSYDICCNNTILEGSRLFQLVSGSAKPWKNIYVVRTVEEFPRRG